MKTDCIIWTGARLKPDSYGSRTVKGRRWLAHRYAYFSSNGPIPSGMMVCHRCNDKGCVNVDHLYLATQKQNVIDAIKDGLTMHCNSKKTACPRCGSDYEKTAEGTRFCRKCKQASNQRTRRARDAMQSQEKAPGDEGEGKQL